MDFRFLAFAPVLKRKCFSGRKWSERKAFPARFVDYAAKQKMSHPNLGMGLSRGVPQVVGIQCSVSEEFKKNVLNY